MISGLGFNILCYSTWKIHSRYSVFQTLHLGGMQFAYFFCTDEQVINAQRGFKSQREDGENTLCLKCKV